MTPLLLGAAWILFVISCFASMSPNQVNAQPTRKPRLKPEGDDYDQAP
jgi:hypothetical protein